MLTPSADRSRFRAIDVQVYETPAPLQGKGIDMRTVATFGWPVGVIIPGTALALEASSMLDFEPLELKGPSCALTELEPEQGQDLLRLSP